VGVGNIEVSCVGVAKSSAGGVSVTPAEVVIDGCVVLLIVQALNTTVIAIRKYINVLYFTVCSSLQIR
jgi:hypothetical protein